jgi:hypothetical protein
VVNGCVVVVVVVVFVVVVVVVVVIVCAECCLVKATVACQQCGGIECIVVYVEIWYKNSTYENAREQNIHKVEPKKRFYFFQRSNGQYLCVTQKRTYGTEQIKDKDFFPSQD